ncbi:MAG: sulfite exporter TauE/SafE family protein [Bacteroidetes bacterium]|nr:MAG: sulfite exporter TauE/SafE family protein [Bacteroidota bacterium]
MTLIEIIALITAGVAVGFINTLAGGGSIISLSVLMYLMGLPAGIANGTNRIAITLQTFTAVSNFKKQEILDWRKGIKLGIPAVVGSIVGAFIAVDIDEEIFEKSMAIIMILMLGFIFYKPSIWLKGKQSLMDQKVGPWQIIIFFFIGIYGGFIHVGIGYLLLIAIVMGAGYDLVKANAIKVLIVLMYVPFSLAVYIYNDQVNYLYGFVLAIGSVFGAYIASKFAVEKGANFVRWVIAVVVLLTALQIFGIIDFQGLLAHSS